MLRRLFLTSTLKLLLGQPFVMFDAGGRHSFGVFQSNVRVQIGKCKYAELGVFTLMVGFRLGIRHPNI